MKVIIGDVIFEGEPNDVVYVLREMGVVLQKSVTVSPIYNPPQTPNIYPYPPYKSALFPTISDVIMWNCPEIPVDTNRV